MTLSALAFLIILITLPVNYAFVKAISFCYDFKDARENNRLNSMKARKA
ncbi:hypothetical protein [Acetilactobacillus jinshanensis]|nr:hypothetical protein [Acetilactobacillus jinshanensis]URL61444.1 hypothetical protein HGK75_05505 [uncultured bacterium]